MLARHISPFEGGWGDVNTPVCPSPPSLPKPPTCPIIASAARTPTFSTIFALHSKT